MTDWSLIRQTNPTARKAHRCDLCGGGISPGQDYYRIRGLHDGAWCTQKQCGYCVPVEEDVAGEYVRPEHVLEDAWGDHPCVEWDGATITLFGLELTATGTRLALYQSTLVPRRGLTEWSLVARRPSSGAFG